MIVYSEKIILFISVIKSSIKRILVNEAGLKVTGNRFYDRQLRFSYPINIVIYPSKSVLGYFDAPFYEIGVNEALMHANQIDLNNVLRHEIAHYLTYIDHGMEILPHGREFKECCSRHGWNEDVQKASICIDEKTSSSILEKGAIFRKVQKLMALAASANQHEAESAMIKSQQLLLKHNMDRVSGGDQDQICLKRIFLQKRKNAKMDAIGKILETFFVSIVYHKALNGTHLEVIGDKVNVEIAEYVANVLENELENLWERVQRESLLKGTLAKNSFYRGVAIGYCNKIEMLKKGLDNETTNALVAIDIKLKRAKEIVYKRLTTCSNFAKHSREAGELGQKMGKNLNINPGIETTSILKKLLTKF